MIPHGLDSCYWWTGAAGGASGYEAEVVGISAVSGEPDYLFQLRMKSCFFQTAEHLGFLIPGLNKT